MDHNRSILRQASLITPRIYLSGLHTARNKDELTNLEITHVISVIERQPTLPTSITPEQTLHIPIADQQDVDILIHLETTTNFISSALAQNETNKVLVSANRASFWPLLNLTVAQKVHCQQGISRSATVVCAYLVATTAMSASESIAHVKELRRVVSPNDGFRAQLGEYGTRFVGKRSSSSQVPVQRVSKRIAERIHALKSANGLQDPEPASNTAPEQDSK